LNHFGHYSAEVKVHDPKKIHYSTYYNDELVEIVSKRCKEDIVKFDYKFEWK